jgi:hypothetical protein
VLAGETLRNAEETQKQLVFLVISPKLTNTVAVGGEVLNGTFSVIEQFNIRKLSEKIEECRQKWLDDVNRLFYLNLIHESD